MSFADHPDTIIELSRRDLDDIIESAAQRGASRALAEIGLDDHRAMDDVKELRSLLSAWRDARRTAILTIVKIATTALATLITAGLALKLGILDDGGGK